MTLKVGQVAALAHVSVRTLRHYDSIGLLEPSGRSASGQRLYSSDDLARLQQILFYRTLGFGLRRIVEIMSAPDFDRRRALLEQRELLSRQVEQLGGMLDLIDRTIAELDGGIRMTKEEMFEVFGDFDPAEHEEEARQRWGDTEAYQESMRRSKGYTKEDWLRFRTESDAINLAVAELLENGVAAEDPRAMNAVERARLMIDQWFYPCSREMHAALGRLYVSDARFTASYEKIRPGLARYVHDAIAANARRSR